MIKTNIWRLRVFAALSLRAARERPLLRAARHLHEADFRKHDDPLISITIATYNRGQILAERTIPSVVRQTYQNFEIVIVGDGCTDDTADRLAALNDPRIKFYNLPERGPYPEDPKYRWMVAGTFPINKALDMAQGKWIAHLDDDDIYLPAHLETVLRFAQQNNLELAYTQMNKQITQEEWVLMGDPKFGEKGAAPHSTVLFRNYLRLFRFEINAWKISFAGDRHVWQRMARCKVRAGFLAQLTVEAPLRPEVTRGDYLAEDRT